MNALITYLLNLLPFTEEELKLITEHCQSLSVKKGQMLLKEGDICRKYTFLVSGCFRMYAVDQKGKEHNISFAAENDWIADIGSFYSEKPSTLNIKALESSLVIQIEQKDLYHLYENITKLNRVFKVMVENKYVELQRHLVQNFSSTAQTRYLSFLEQYPKIKDRLSNAQIASYLGITPEFLSKVRKDIMLEETGKA
ncbi:Crp/Fnr family transcriptional regulator [Jiulongibacter sediminis]|uniref:Crp/Fnr family transcriptional regulator n=1 Tax=Jiulongibacter sediminis TaxID=1605367 RepID=UPI0026F2CA85|nr:Crp/Fnr family transcriptional regulator [Jiulongibacter sediminis]